MLADRPTIVETLRAYRSGELSPETVVDECLERIARLDDRLHAWVLVDEHGSRKAAASAARQLAADDRRPLLGVPVGVKDIIDVAGWPTKAGSPLRKNHVARADADVVAHLRQAGAIILGKTVTTEFACFDPPPTCNPWDINRTPGGSSSGSAVAVATGMALGATGSQTGGSINRPASYCGICGFKPTFGRVSRRGVVPVSRHLDHVGPIASCVADLAILYEALRSRPGTGRETENADLQFQEEDIGCRFPGAPRLGVITPWLDTAEQPVHDAVREALERLRMAGATLEPAPLPDSFHELPALQRCIMAVEAAEYHRAMFSKNRDDYGPSLRELIEEGLNTAAVDYARALRLQGVYQGQFNAAIRNYDAWLAPATPNEPPDPSTTGSAAFNAPLTYLGLPAVSLPCGLSPRGLPVALQVVGRAFADRQTLDVAGWCESVLTFRALPPLLGSLGQ